MLQWFSLNCKRPFGACGVNRTSLHMGSVTKHFISSSDVLKAENLHLLKNIFLERNKKPQVTVILHIN